MSGDDRTRTGGLSLDKRVLCTSELRPHEIREEEPCFDQATSLVEERRQESNLLLELMRLAGLQFPTAQSGWLESNQRSPAPEAGGMSVFPTARRTAGREGPPAGLEPALPG